MTHDLAGPAWQPDNPEQQRLATLAVTRRIPSGPEREEILAMLGLGVDPVHGTSAE